METKYYTKDGKRWTGGSIVLNGRRVFNPSHEQLIAAGYELLEEQPYVPTLDEIKARKIAEIDAYDTSEAVNAFMLDGNPVWLDKATRVGLMNSLNCEKDAGREETTLWLGTTPIMLPVDTAVTMLSELELYALACYNVTASHKAAVGAFETIEAVNAYDHTQGYPDRPRFSTTE